MTLQKYSQRNLFYIELLGHITHDIFFMQQAIWGFIYMDLYVLGFLVSNEPQMWTIWSSPKLS